VSDSPELAELRNAVRWITDGVDRLLAALVKSGRELLVRPDTMGVEETEEVERQVVTLVIVSLLWRAMLRLVDEGQSTLEVDGEDLEQMKQGEIPWTPEALVTVLLGEARTALVNGLLEGLDRLDEEYEERVGTCSAQTEKW